MTVCRWMSGSQHFKIRWESLAQRHGVISKKTLTLRNTAVRTTILTLSLQCYKTDIEVPWCPSCYNSATTSHSTNVWCEIYIEFNTTITLVLLTKYMDLISAVVSHNCGFRTTSRIVNVGVSIHMTKLSYNTHHTQYWQTENHFHQHFRTFRFYDKSWCSSVTVSVWYSSDRRAPQEFLIAKCLARQTWTVMEGVCPQGGQY
jgi:hypothetical protein